MANANFDRNSLASGIERCFQTASGDMLALPLYIGETQFFVNEPLLSSRLHIFPKTSWSIDDIRTVLLAANQDADLRTRQLIVGTQWQGNNMWGSFVLGFGGNFLSSVGRWDLSQSLVGTERLVELARLARWTLEYYASPGEKSPAGDFVRQGFAGLAQYALFGFAVPAIDGLNYVGSSQHTITAPRKAFPTFPVRQVVPAMSPGAFGLGLSKASAHLTEALQFVLWLYKVPQQKLLASFGMPPVIMSPQLQQFWTQLGPPPPEFPLFRYDGYVDPNSMMPSPYTVCADGMLRMTPNSNYDVSLIRGMISAGKGVPVPEVLDGLQKQFAAAEAQALC